VSQYLQGQLALAVKGQAQNKPRLAGTSLTDFTAYMV
jgi:hypothetical protein